MVRGFQFFRKRKGKCSSCFPLMCLVLHFFVSFPHFSFMELPQNPFFFRFPSPLDLKSLIFSFNSYPLQVPKSPLLNRPLPLATSTCHFDPLTPTTHHYSCHCYSCYHYHYTRWHPLGRKHPITTICQIATDIDHRPSPPTNIHRTI